MMIWEDEVDEIFPHFDKDNIDMAEISILNADDQDIGVFMAEYKGEELHVVVDYVIPEYRDIGVGEEYFAQKIEDYKKMGFKNIVALTDDAKHREYLTRCGFQNSAKHNDLFELGLN